MPIYDYKCRACGATSELLQQGMQERTVNCLECGSTDMERLLSSSYSFRMGSQAPGTTCCGRSERCGSAQSPGGKSCCGSG